MASPNDQEITGGVLMGGCSSEREISLKSGRAVVEALNSSGMRAIPLVLNQDSIDEVEVLLARHRVDVVFVALHGRFGEDGTLQSALEAKGWAYTGSGPEASRRAMNKKESQKIFRQAGLTVPLFYVASRSDPKSMEEIRRLTAQGRWVVKPVHEGSSVGVGICGSPEESEAAFEQAFAYDEEILVEEFIEGQEVAVSVWDGRSLPVVAITPQSHFFDYTAKYTPGMTTYKVPAELSTAITRQLKKDAEKAFDVLGCRDFARMDFIIRSSQCFILEANTIPGMTETSLFPKAARAAGFSFPEVCRRLMETAWQRSQIQSGISTDASL